LIGFIATFVPGRQRLTGDDARDWADDLRAMSGMGKAPFKVQVRVSFGYDETGAFPEDVQDGFDVDLPTVTDPIAQSQWITVARSLGATGASRFTVARTPFE
jgi:hypothetical protein